MTSKWIDGAWVFRCIGANHAAYEWQPKITSTASGYPGEGLAAELGVYDDLLVVVDEGFAEYGVLEYRFSKRAPKTYQFLVDRYGHTALGPAGYTASAFLAGAVRLLMDEDLIYGCWTEATGYWSYNGTIGAYGPVGTPESADPLSWEDFATDTLRVDPYDWPALGFRTSDS